MSVALRYLHFNIVLLPSLLAYGSLILAVCRRLMLHEVEHARLLAQCRTDASRELREVIGGVQQLVSQLPVALVEGIVPLWRFVAQRTSPVAERHAAVHAAACLYAAIVLVQRLLHLAEVVDAVVYRPVTGLFAFYCKKCFWITHILRPPPYPSKGGESEVSLIVNIM